MSLLRKFAILLGLFALTVGAGLGAAFAFGVVLERDVAGPFRDATEALGDLSRLKRSLAGLQEAIDDGAYERTGESAMALGADLSLSERHGLGGMVSGGSARNLRARVERTVSLADAWAGAPNADEEGRLASEVADELKQTANVIEAIEAQVLDDAERSAAFGDEMRRLHHIVLFSGILSSGLLGVLGVMLFRRWLVAPIATLDEATQRIARGDFAHRVRVDGSGELATLGQRFNAMAGSIAVMQSEAVERERLAAVGEMVRRLAHNLRNPLAGIRNLAELTRMQGAGDATIAELQGEIIGAVDRFNVWLEELLNVTSPLNLAIEEREVTPWLEGVVASHAPLARMRGVRLQRDFGEAPARARFDARHLEHAVVAVLTNAIQASPADSTVRVSARGWTPSPSEGGTGEWWEIAVRDEGRGIEPELRERVFRPYFTTKRDGNGIGLAIALQVVKRHGGRIDLWTQEGQGALFRLRIPANPPPDKSADAAEVGPAVSDRPTPESGRARRGVNTGG